MKLDDFFRTVAPFLQGRASHPEAQRALYGSPPGPHELDARRLALYGGFARAHRFEVLENLYPHLRGALEAHGGQAAWEALVEAYFQRHPMRHFEMNANAALLPEFLQQYAPDQGLPGWMVELADLEWWEWQTLVAPEEPTHGGGPRLSSIVELRPYTHELLEWLRPPAPQRAPRPQQRECLVLFWRDARHQVYHKSARPLELLVLKAVSEQQTLSDAAAGSGAPLEALRHTYDALLRDGVLRE